jgi:hypothetical protein
MMTFTSAKREDVSGWSRNVMVGDQEYAVSVRRGKSVRIPYKPRGKNRGFHWHGSVYKIGKNCGQVWSDRVPGSIGCRGLLIEAGVIDP